jgi:hypothetical protein
MQSDKLKHFIVGGALGALSYFFSVGYGFIFASLIFIGKEIYDCYKPNPTGFDELDLLADYLGYFLILIIFLNL